MNSLPSSKEWLLRWMDNIEVRVDSIEKEVGNIYLKVLAMTATLGTFASALTFIIMKVISK